MEFLMTYGWAILAAVLAVAALAYYGVFQPGNNLPDTCTLSGLVSCDESLVNTTGPFVVLRNGAGASVNITSIDVNGCTTLTPYTSISDGSTGSYQVTCSGLSAGDKFSKKITVKYKISGKTLESTGKGDIRGIVR